MPDSGYKKTDGPSTETLAAALNAMQAALGETGDIHSAPLAAETVMAGMKARGCETFGELCEQVQTELEAAGWTSESGPA